MNNIGELNNNSLVFRKINNLEQDFGSLFKPNNSIIYKYCTHMKINFNNTINKIVFMNCSNIQLNLSKTISGLELKNCSDMHIFIKPNFSLYSVVIEKCKDIDIHSINKENIFIDIDNNSSLKLI
jgi:hypothetical protein